MADSNYIIPSIYFLCYETSEAQLIGMTYEFLLGMTSVWHFQPLAQRMPCSLCRPRTFCPVTAVCFVDHCRSVVLIVTDTQTETERLKLINLFNIELSPKRYSARGLTDPSRWRGWGWGEVGGGGTIPKEVTLI